jgi:hypothetical protein
MGKDPLVLGTLWLGCLERSGSLETLLDSNGPQSATGLGHAAGTTGVDIYLFAGPLERGWDQ